MAAIGWWWARRRHELTPAVRFLVAAIAVASVLSLGLHLHVFGTQPYGALRRWAPGFARLRSPFRFAVVVQALLLPLFAVGLQRIGKRPGFGRLAVASLVLVAMAEVAAAPTGLTPIPPESTPWSRWLRSQPGHDAVALVPFAPGPKAAAFAPTVEAMLVSLDHHKPLVNGYSGFFPDSYDRLAADSQTFPSGTALAALHQSGARWVVIDNHWLTPSRRSALAPTGRLTQRFRDHSRTIYELH